MSTIEEVMESLVAKRSPHLPAEALAEVFDHLIWCLDDNGEEIESVRRKWLEGKDKYKVAISLAMNEVFPGSSREDLTRLFQGITARWPEFQTACEATLAQWDEQFAAPVASPQENGIPAKARPSQKGIG